jgi:hypothetical protein
MEAKELRIGNYINGIYETEIDKGNGIIEDIESCDIVKVVALDSVNITEYCIWIEAGSREQYDSFEPIPLTEEWLIKFGFIKDAFTEYTYDNLTKEGVSLWNKKDDYSELWYQGKNNSIQIKHVHQLENLYFALTNKELTIK